MGTFPEDVWVSAENKCVKIAVKEAFKFNQLRRKLMTRWKIDHEGAQVKQTTSYIGSKDAPLNLDEYGISVSSLLIAVNLLGPEHG